MRKAPEMNSSPLRGGIEWLRPLLFKGNVSLLFLKTVEPSLQQVPLGHDFVHRMCHTKDSVVCLELQCGSGIAYATHLSSPGAIQTRRPCHGSCQKAPKADFRGRGCISRPPTERAGWLGWAGLGWAYKGGGCSVPKSSAPFGRGPAAVGPQPIKDNVPKQITIRSWYVQPSGH